MSVSEESYQTPGVPRTASQGASRLAYRTLAKQRRSEDLFL